MNLKTKKIIAKEIIFFFSIIALLIMTWGILELRNSYLLNKINNNSKAFSYSINSNLKKTLRDFVATSNNQKYETETELLSKFPELKIYNIQILRDFVATSNSGKYKSENELYSKFPEFFNKKSKTEYNIINKELNDSKSKLLNKSKFKNILCIMSLIFFSLLYPIRLIFFLLKWAFKTLN